MFGCILSQQPLDVIVSPAVNVNIFYADITSMRMLKENVFLSSVLQINWLLISEGPVRNQKSIWISLINNIKLWAFNLFPQIYLTFQITKAYHNILEYLILRYFSFYSVIHNRHMSKNELLFCITMITMPSLDVQRRVCSQTVIRLYIQRCCLLEKHMQ